VEDVNLYTPTKFLKYLHKRRADLR